MPLDTVSPQPLGWGDTCPLASNPGVWGEGNVSSILPALVTPREGDCSFSTFFGRKSGKTLFSGSEQGPRKEHFLGACAS